MSGQDPVAWLRKEIGDDLAFARACLQRPIGGTDFDAVNERVARCEAELAILDEHGPDCIGEFGEQVPARCQRCITDRDPYPEMWRGDSHPCRTVRLLASGYRHRPGFPAAFAA